MTKRQWRELKVGDVIVERRSGAHRLVLDLSRRGSRVCITLDSLKENGALVTCVSSDDTRGKRWRLR